MDGFKAKEAEISVMFKEIFCFVSVLLVLLEVSSSAVVVMDDDDDDDAWSDEYGMNDGRHVGDDRSEEKGLIILLDEERRSAVEILVTRGATKAA
jgi:hypothetical protein